MPPRKPDPLGPYRSKRALERTPEPSGSLSKADQPGAGGLFVVHKHAARRLHFDLRLEMEGVLRSWAVPRGPSYDTADKRLAVLVEDHPMEYGDFEGIIPEGNYGAGAVIVWDRGRWEPAEDPVAGLEKGKLLFDLHGVKLRGRWTLVKLKKGEKEWLLIKERDAYATASGPPPPEESVLSGLTVEDLKAGRTPADGIRADLERLGAVKREVQPDASHIMLAESRERPFSDPAWLFELKLDGYRLLAFRQNTTARLISRNGNDLSASFPEVIRALTAVPTKQFLIDGEVVALDEQGRPSFQRLQQRGKLTRPLDVRRGMVEHPVTFFAFDVLGVEDFDLRALPLSARKQVLQRLLPHAGLVRYLDYFEADGEVLYEQTQKLDLEGIVAKKADSAYRSGRSANWLKIRTRLTDDFVVVGFTAPKGGRSAFGALLLGQYVEGNLVYTGRAGSGFSDNQLAEVRAGLDALTRDTPPCTGPIPQEKGITWTEPHLVCEVEFTEWTEEGLLRQPVFLRFREDKPPEECVGTVGRWGGSPLEAREAGQEGGADEQEAAVTMPASKTVSPSPAAQRAIQFSNLNKTFWPEQGYTKGDLIEYYRTIAPWLLPYLQDRPVVLTRYPDGIAGKSFFQKDAPGFIPDWVRTERMWSEQAAREIDYFVCDDEPGLLYIVNLGTIPLHIWASRTTSLELPDWCILDLDPKEAPFAHVIRVAQTAHRLCEEIGLPHLVKTSGSSGLHVMIPLAGQCTYEQCRSLGELLARLIVGELPEIATITRQVTRRDGKVYVDYLQNGSGRLLVAPFSARPLPGAPVSMPLRWSEVNDTLNIRSFTIENAVARMRKLKVDPMRKVLIEVPDLSAVLATLVERGRS
jgi:bifunctional non-homologous end joining protein LigD